MSFAYSFGALALGALLLGCGFPVDDSKYEVDDNFNRIVEAFAKDDQGCKECLSSCTGPINECVAIQGCTEFAECVRAAANPAGQASCHSQMVDVPFPTKVAYTDVVYCWMECKSQCAVGTNWDCLDGYSVTQPPSPQVRVQQSFKHLCGGAEVRDAEVTYCAIEEPCSETATAVTDESGTYSVPLSISVQSPVVGWQGIRRVVHESLAAPHRLERNLPIWSDQVELTRLLSESCGANGIVDLTAADDSADWGSAIAVQLFDCDVSGAEGVALEVTTAPDAVILYTTSNGLDLDYVTTSSSASGDGSALVANLPEGEHELVAWETKSGKLVGTGRVTVTGGEVIMYSLLPKPWTE